MDTITHGIAGALIGKAVLRGEDMFASRPMNRGRIITWSLMLGAIFPDSDVFRDIFSHDRLLVITWHRSITHSLILLPLWVLLLAGITRLFANSRKWEAPSFAALVGIYAVGILSHILLDLVTSFGTMVWSPLQWSRPAWDLIFIIDFTLTGILLVPQLLAWVYAHPEKTKGRAVGMWLAFMPVPFLIARRAFPPARATRLGRKDFPQQMESRWPCCSRSLCCMRVLRAPRRVLAHSKVHGAVLLAGRIDWSITAPAIAVALGRAGSNAARCLRTPHGPERQAP